VKQDAAGSGKVHIEYSGFEAIHLILSNPESFDFYVPFTERAPASRYQIR
jgi:hypothetical protein